MSLYDMIQLIVDNSPKITIDTR